MWWNKFLVVQRGTPFPQRSPAVNEMNCLWLMLYPGTNRDDITYRIRYGYGYRNVMAAFELQLYNGITSIRYSYRKGYYWVQR